MKIEKGYTLSQFIDYAHNSGVTGLAIPSINNINMEYMNHIGAYNNFLKQPLTKEMFINPLEMPSYAENAISDGDKLTEWGRAEKKVIFSNIAFRDRNMFEKDILLDGLFIGVERKDKTFALGGKTIHDVAEITKGRITLKNVTI